MGGIGDATCSDMYSGNLPATCGGAFASPGDLADMGTGLMDVAGAFGLP
jgi:hypothetical protein